MERVDNKSTTAAIIYTTVLETTLQVKWYKPKQQETYDSICLIKANWCRSRGYTETLMPLTCPLTSRMRNTRNMYNQNKYTEVAPQSAQM